MDRPLQRPPPPRALLARDRTARVGFSLVDLLKAMWLVDPLPARWPLGHPLSRARAQRQSITLAAGIAPTRRPALGRRARAVDNPQPLQSGDGPPTAAAEARVDP